MLVDAVLTNARAFFHGSLVECCLAVNDGRIFKIGKAPNMPKADEHLDVAGNLVLPGMIDAHVHLRDEGKAYKEDFYTGTAAAVAGGVTTVLDMPNNEPVTMSAEALKQRISLAERKVVANVGFYSEFPETLEEIDEIVGCGAVGFKLFMGHQTGGLNVDDDKAIAEAFEQVKRHHIPVAAHAEDQQTVKTAQERLKHAGRHDIDAFLEAHAESAELLAVQRLLKVNADINTRLHLCHITTRGSLAVLVDAKNSGMPLSCEVTPQHLLFSITDYANLGNMLVMVPPPRSKRDIDALWEGVVRGWVDLMVTDHAPHILSEKNASSVWEVKVGIPGLETLLPLALTFVKNGRLSLQRVVKLLCEKPADIFGLKDRGMLEQGKKADIVVVDFNRKFKVDASKFHSKAKYSPFNGWTLQGKPVKTFVNGQLAMEEDEILLKPGFGCVIRGCSA
jgi:dihydroorotase (multifunctional complex type)